MVLEAPVFALDYRSTFRRRGLGGGSTVSNAAGLGRTTLSLTFSLGKPLLRLALVGVAGYQKARGWPGKRPGRRSGLCKP